MRVSFLVCKSCSCSSKLIAQLSSSSPFVMDVDRSVRRVDVITSSPSSLASSRVDIALILFPRQRRGVIPHKKRGADTLPIPEETY